MSILNHTTDFIQAWEKDCKASHFTLRFPVFTDFIFYLENTISAERFDKIYANVAQMKNLRTLFYAVLKAHIGDLCIKEELWNEQGIA